MPRPSSPVGTWIWFALLACWVFAMAPKASAQPGAVDLLATVQDSAPGQKARVHTTPDGALQFVAAPPGGHFSVPASAGHAELQARAFLKLHRVALGVATDRIGFEVRSLRPGSGRTTVRFDQLYGGVPVFGAQALFQVRSPEGKSEGIESAVLDLLRNTAALDVESEPTTPDLAEKTALEIALGDVAADHPGADLGPRAAPKLVVFAPEVLDLEGLPRLARQVDVGTPWGFPAERLLIDARDGSVLLRYSLAHRALNREVFDAQHGSSVPATPARAEGDPATGVGDVDDAYDFSEDTYSFYFTEHGRDSLDDAGRSLDSVVNFCPQGNCAVDDAFWNGTRTIYTDGMVADDVVGHEFTHGVTQLTSDLIYLNQSGAITESFSDIWGEFIDLTNGVGNDGSSVRWLIAEDAATGVLRDMENPPAEGDPDSTCHPNYFEGVGDNGGVHINSGILNKLAYLLVDGGTHNGHTVTGMGIPLAADLFYEIQINLLVPGSNFVGVYHALTQAGLNLGLAASQRANLDAAMRAVQIDPESNCHPPPSPPGNDECADALPITYGEMIGYTTEGTLSGAVTCAADEATDVWYVFTATVDETVTFSTCSFANFDTSLSVFDGCGGARLVCNDDDLSCGLESTAGVAVTTGEDYYVRVSGFGGQFGNFVLSVAGEGEGGDACGGALLEVSAADFETDLSGFTPTGLWHRTNACRTLDAEHTSDYALYFGADATCNYVTGQTEQGHATASVDLTTAEGVVRLSYDHILQWSGSGELVDLEVSSDGGVNWDPVASNTSPPFLFPRSSWECAEYDLSDHAGDNLLLRFGFDTVNPVGFDVAGFYIDDLLVEAEGFQGVGVPVPCEPPGDVAYVAYEADFESDDEGYALNGLWHRSATCAATRPSHASQHGLYFGVDNTCDFNTGKTEAGEATSPPIDLGGLDGLLLLSLRYHLETDENLDLATVEISNDDGQTWVPLASNAGVPQLADGGGVWKCGIYNISAYAGQTVRVRLSFDSVFAALNQFGGFFIDDVRITSGVRPLLHADDFETGGLSRWSVWLP